MPPIDSSFVQDVMGFDVTLNHQKSTKHSFEHTMFCMHKGKGGWQISLINVLVFE